MYEEIQNTREEEEEEDCWMMRGERNREALWNQVHTARDGDRPNSSDQSSKLPFTKS